MDEKEIIVLVRNINGKRSEYRFENKDKLLEADIKCFNEEDEILLITWAGICIYNELQSSFPVIWEDIFGFFA